MRIKDYAPLLREAIAEARAVGLDTAADHLEQAAFTAFTTSSELLQEQGIAIRQFLKATRGKLPARTKEKLRVLPGRNRHGIARLAQTDRTFEKKASWPCLKSGAHVRFLPIEVRAGLTK